MRPALIAPPAELPVTLEEAKARLRVDGTAWDVEIAGLIASAVSYLDGYTGILGMCLEAQTWEIRLDRFPAAEIHVPLGPVASVVSVAFVDPDGVEQIVAPESYVLDATPGFSGWIVPAADFSWPSTMATVNAVRLLWVAGRGTPAALKEAILTRVEERFDRAAGADSQALRRAFNDLIAPFRRPSI